MTENWVEWQAEIRVSPPQTETGFLILKKDMKLDTSKIYQCTATSGVAI